MTTRVPMTAQGAEKLQAELEHLKKVRRPEIIAAIERARALGDLKENGDYHAAREQQGYIEGRISEIEFKLSQAQIIDVLSIPPTGKVIFGSTVTLLRLDDDSQVKYRIVGEDEANVPQGLLSVTSPVARALVGKQEGDVLSVTTPAGMIDYEVLSVEHL